MNINKERILITIISSLFFLIPTINCSQLNNEICTLILGHLEKKQPENLSVELTTALNSVCSRRTELTINPISIRILVIAAAFNAQKYHIAQPLLQGLPNVLATNQICLRDDLAVESSPQLTEIKDRLKELFEIIHKNKVAGVSKTLDTLPLSDSFISWASYNKLLHSRELEPNASMVLCASRLPVASQLSNSVEDISDSKLPEIPFSDPISLIDFFIDDYPTEVQCSKTAPYLRGILKVTETHDSESSKPDTTPAPQGYVKAFFNAVGLG